MRVAPTPTPSRRRSLHVDFEPDLATFYFSACGFLPTDAALIHLYSLE